MELNSYKPVDLSFLAEEAAKFMPIKSTSKLHATVVEAGALGEAPTPSGSSGTNRPVRYEGPPGSYDRIARECAFIRHWAEDADGLPEPEWFAGISIVARCEDGPDIVQEYSALDPRYDEAETESKIDHALDNAGPRTCANIFQGLGFDECEQCVYRKHITSPIQLGYIRGGSDGRA